ncbi:MAG: hypothetical protein ACKOQ8_01730 [Micrococcales bacterium]
MSWFEGLLLETGITWIQVVEPSSPSDDHEPTFVKNSDLVSNAEDRELLFGARSQADVILVTEKTASAEKYRPSKFAPILVIDRSGSYTPPPEVLGKHPIRVLPSVEDALAANPLDSSKILLESGPTLASALAKQALLGQAIVVVTTLDRRAAEGALTNTLTQLGVKDFDIRVRFQGHQNTAFVARLHL